MDKNKNNNSLENIAWSVMEKKPPKLKRYILGADQNKDRGLRDHTATGREQNSDVRRKKGGLALFTEKPQEACDVMQSLYTDTNLSENKSGHPSHVPCAVRTFLHEYSLGSF